MTDTAAPCPQCGEAIVPGDAYCESCGTLLAGGPAVSASSVQVREESFPVPRTTFSQAPGIADVCSECGGDVLDDGFCSQCGKKAPSPRDHWQEAPVAWIGRASCRERVSFLV